MSRRDPMVRVRHMLDHACEAAEMLQGHPRSNLDSDRVLSLALVRLMEIVGEASARTPQSFRDRHPQIPWQDIADLRNRLIHGYDAVDLDILWTIVHEDMPTLIDQLQDVIDSESP